MRALVLLASLAFVGCAVSTCDHLSSIAVSEYGTCRNTIFPLTYASACEGATLDCSSNDFNLIGTFSSCFEGVPPCDSTNLSTFNADLATCEAGLSALSTSCAVAFDAFLTGSGPAATDAGP